MAKASKALRIQAALNDDVPQLAESDQLTIHKFHDGPIHSIAVADIGTNTASLIICDSDGEILDEYGEKCALGKGTVPNDPAPQLNPGGVEELENEVLPRWEKMMRRHEPDAVVVMCTEAVRASLRNPNENEAALDMLRMVADALVMPVEAITIVSGKLEAELAARAMLRGGHRHGIGIMMGGGSTELFELNRGTIVSNHCVTLRFGMQSLASCDDSHAVIGASFDRLPWLKQNISDEHVNLLGFYGGPSRNIGRLLNQKMAKTSFDARMLFGGYTFEGEGFIRRLEKLQEQTREDLLEATFGKPDLDDLKRTEIDGDPYVKINGVWVPEKKFEDQLERWEEKIGKRVDTLRHAAAVAIEACKRVKPDVVTFGPQNLKWSAIEVALKQG